MGAAMAEPATFSPQQAAAALADVERYEDALSTRLGALTGMVWGLVSAAIFVTYGFAPDVSPGWLVPFLWLPWTLAGILVTRCLWTLHALGLRGRPETASPRHGWGWTAGFGLLFLVAIVGLQALDLQRTAFTYMLAVNALAAFGVSAVVSRLSGRLAATPMLGAGALLLAGAFALAWSGFGTMAQAFASAGLVATAFVGGGLLGFVRG